MTSRQIRRAAERRQNKQARRSEQISTPEQHSQPLTEIEIEPEPAPEAATEEPLIVPDQTHYFCPSANRSTGPRSPEGKARSSMNNLRHGLTGTFHLLHDESRERFAELQAELEQEHAPTTPTELILVEKMAEHLWLSRRAHRFQHLALDRDNTKDFALFLRYQTTCDRAFYKALHELRALRTHANQFESHEATVRLVNARAHTLEQETEIRGRIEAPLPGNAAIPFDLAKRLIGDSLKQAHTHSQHWQPRKPIKS